MQRLMIIGRQLVSSRLVVPRVEHYSTTYKSSISLDKLYPGTNLDLTAKLSSIKKDASDTETFSGYIPIDKLQISHTLSSKPGGQHVNKTQSAVEIRFHVDSSEWIPKWIRDKIKEKNVNRINREGFLVMRSDKTRKAVMNQADCLERIRALIHEASEKPRGLSDDEKLKIDIDKRIAAGRRVLEKRQRSENKSLRRHPVYDSTYDYYGKGN